MLLEYKSTGIRTRLFMNMHLAQKQLISICGMKNE